MSYEQFPVKGPFEGHVDNVPNPHTPANSFDEIINWFCIKGRLRTRNRLIVHSTPPDNAAVRLMKTFKDVQNNPHTLALTTQHAYFLTTGPTWNLLTLPSPMTTLAGTALPYGHLTTNNRIYFSNGSVQVLYADGESSIKDSNHPGSARFLALLNSHLITAYTTEPEPGVSGSTLYPKRVRWSKQGDQNTWTGFTSGFEDLLDVPDEITGLVTLGRNVLVARNNGFTQMVGSGIAGAPFDFPNLTLSEQGIGNYYPYSLAQYHDMAAFVSIQDIYTLNSGLQLQPIGGKAKKKIMANLNDATGTVCGYAMTHLAPGIDFLSYWLVIPGPNVVWVYNFDEGSWFQFESTQGVPTFIGSAIA